MDNQTKEINNLFFRNKDSIRIIESGLSEMQNNGYDLETLCYFYPYVGNEYEHGLAFYGRAVNGWDSAKPKSLFELANLNRSPFIRFVKNISEHYYGLEYYRKIVWSNMYKIADCDSGNPTADMRRIQYESACQMVKLEMESLKPKVCVIVTGNSIGTNDSWDEPLWDGWLNKRKWKELESVIWCHNEHCIATIYQADEQYFILTERPEGHSEQSHANAIFYLIDKWVKNLRID